MGRSGKTLAKNGTQPASHPTKPWKAVRAMKPRKSRDVALMLVGLVCLAASIPGCIPRRPVFSPDGSKILYYSKTTGGVVYDRTSHTWDVIFTMKEGDVITQWTADGKEAVILWPEPAHWDHKEETLRVLVLPLGTGNPTRLFSLAARKGLGDEQFSKMSYSAPPPVVGDHLFLPGESVVHRLNLKTGAIKSKYFEKGLPFLWSDGQEVYYLSGAPGGGEECEIGRLEKDTLERSALQRLITGGFCEVGSFIAMSKDIPRYAGTAIEDGTGMTFIFHGNDLEKRIPVGSAANRTYLGSMQWSSDGATIYAAYAKELAEEKLFQVGVLAMAADGSVMREIPLLHDEWAMDFWFSLYEFQIALSPDGNTIAAAWSPEWDKVKKEGLGLYLVDLPGPDPKVTRIPFPENLLQEQN